MVIRGQHIWHDRRGQALVEFALVAPLLLFFLFAIIQMGLLFNGFISIEQAARIGVREASLGEDSQLVGCSIYNQVNTGIFPVAATVYWSENSSPGSSSTGTSTTSSLPTVTVHVKTSYPLMVPLPGFGPSIPIGQQYTMVQETPPSSSSGTTSSGSFTLQNPPKC